MPEGSLAEAEAWAGGDLLGRGGQHCVQGSRRAGAGGRRLLEGLGEEGLLGDLMGWRGVEQAFGCVRGSSGQAWGCCPRV